MEIWKKIEGFENYSVSSEGRVRNDKLGTEKKTRFNSCGYSQINLRIFKNRKAKSKLVHRLVAQTFLPNPNNYKEVNHLNGIKSDNRVENLEWCSKSENMKHAFRTGLQSTKGSKNGFNVLTEIQVIEIRKLYSEGWLQRELARKFGVTRPNIGLIVNRKSWTHI